MSDVDRQLLLTLKRDNKRFKAALERNRPIKVPDVPIIDGIIIAREKLSSAQSLWTCNKIVAVQEALRDLKTAEAFIKNAITRMTPYVGKKYLP